jgi:hypothetical protein
VSAGDEEVSEVADDATVATEAKAEAGAEPEPEPDPERSTANRPDGTARRRGATRLPVWLLVAVGIAIGALLGLGAAALVGGDDGDDTPRLELQPSDTVYPPDQAATADRFLDAWRRYREATFVAELAFERTLPDGQTLSSSRVVVQDPPRRLVRQGDSTTTTDRDATMLCEPVGDETRCTTQPGVDYEATVDAEVDEWRDAISGDVPQYAISEPEPGCFDLHLVVRMIAPPYGTDTRVCFDDATGALLRRQVVRDTGTDTEEATRLTATVTEADWER